MKGYIKIVLTRPSGSRSEAKTHEVTQPMIDAVEEAIYTLMTGKRVKSAKRSKR